MTDVRHKPRRLHHDYPFGIVDIAENQAYIRFVNCENRRHGNCQIR
jgi:hypothetical protein